METIESVWVNFWNCYGISTGAGPLVGLINSVDDRRPTAVVAITEKSFLWIADLRVKPIAKVISFDEEHNVFLIGNKPVSIADLPALFEKLLSLITDYRVGWLRLVPRSKTRNSLGRNLYWDKIADSLAEKIHFLGAAEITSIGTPQHLILNGMLNGLSRLRRCAVFLSTSDLTLPWASMMEEKSPLDDALSNGFLAHIFTKTTEEILSTGVVEVAGKRLPVEVVYDLYCEFTQDSVIKRVFGKLDARWFGVATSNNDEDRQFFWLTAGISFDQFVTILITTVDTLIADLSILHMTIIKDRVYAIPVGFLPITSDASKAQFLSGLVTVAQKVATLQGFIEWNCELFPEIKTAKQLLSNTATRIDTIIRTLQTSEKPSDTLAGQIESTRARIQFSIHLMSEKISVIHSQDVLNKLSGIVADVEMVLSQG